MMWLGIAVGVLALVALVAALGVISLRRARDDVEVADVDPLFTAGIALMGAGVALATTVGAVMYAIMAVGLIVMAVGAHRTRHHGRS